MNNTHQTSEDLLLRHAAGRLRPAPAMVVESHLAMSASSRQLFADLEAVGGILLDEQPMANVSTDLFQRTLQMLDRPQMPQSGEPAASAPSMDIRLPEPLANLNIGRWRWVSPGIHYAKVEVPEDPDHTVILLKVQAGRALPLHSHSGEEVTLVLKGTFQDEGGAYRTGDMLCEDEETDHTPMVSDDGECICLIAIEGRLRFRQLSARLLQPWIGL